MARLVLRTLFWESSSGGSPPLSPTIVPDSSQDLQIKRSPVTNFPVSNSPFFVGLVATTKTVRAPSFLSDPIKRQGRREVPSFGLSPLAYPSSLGITTPHYSSSCQTPGASRLPEF
ncbi:hypothetical protein BDQ94DRAFT_126352 [Aspergillus welwitschiae]|uniref:Uncharacterized protein n=1 Tax=Aspergillus welwitschiae TaxID=1341132 RepID=A0A3F3Q9P0_9EURO|nr:hypothetical protein BDQ94DRAFT_126352 [Aspergillus welwitschiae]RDH35924.1 hypothetical protein BDQ94DRAFT_126352 [Aspergillus welwitschiae]